MRQTGMIGVPYTLYSGYGAHTWIEVPFAVVMGLSHTGIDY